jgi:pSer/pThr/pTyr-binding forkhead associated (FHA) protein
VIFHYNASMQLILKVVRGPREGDLFRILPNIKIGRNRRDINLKDPKVSSLHAKIEEDSEGRLVLTDQNSANGIVVAGRQVKTLILEPGSMFELGTSLLEVVLDKQSDTKDLPEWRLVLADYLERSANRTSSENVQIESLYPAIELEVIRGPQTGETAVFGYGPRMIGRFSADFPIYDSECPDTAFELAPTETGPVFLTEHPDIVSINGKNLASKSIEDGDSIQINATKITLRFLGRT